VLGGGGHRLKAFSVFTSGRVNLGIFPNPHVLPPFLGVLIWAEAQALAVFIDFPGRQDRGDWTSVVEVPGIIGGLQEPDCPSKTGHHANTSGRSLGCEQLK
jgi:hypothetical protein